MNRLSKTVADEFSVTQLINTDLVQFSDNSEVVLTLQTVSVQQLLAFLMHLDPALGTAHTLPGDAPQQPLALVAVCRRGGSPNLKVVWCGAGDGVDESLYCLLEHMVFLQKQKKKRKKSKRRMLLKHHSYPLFCHAHIIRLT